MAIRLKGSSRRWAKAKTACLQHLCVTEEGLLGCPMISIHSCTHTKIQAALLIGDIAIISTTGVLGALSPQNWVKIKTTRENKANCIQTGCGGGSLCSSTLSPAPHPPFTHGCVWLKFHTAGMRLP